MLLKHGRIEKHAYQLQTVVDRPPQSYILRNVIITPKKSFFAKYAAKKLRDSFANVSMVMGWIIGIEQ